MLLLGSRTEDNDSRRWRRHIRRDILRQPGIGTGIFQPCGPRPFPSRQPRPSYDLYRRGNETLAEMVARGGGNKDHGARNLKGSNRQIKPLLNMKPYDTEHTPEGTLWQLFRSFFKIGLFTFGGGYAMIPLMQTEVVDKRGWVDKERFLELLTLAQSSPGPISLNTAVFVGYNLGKLKGAAVGLLGVILPSFAVILLIALYFSGIRHNKVFEAAFNGMRPAVVALIAAPIIGLAKGMGVGRLAIAAGAALLVWLAGVSPIWLIIAGAAGGILWLMFLKKGSRKAAGKDTESATGDSVSPAMPEYPFETPAEETFKMPDQ